jgi:hypothetical protein
MYIFHFDDSKQTSGISLKERGQHHLYFPGLRSDILPSGTDYVISDSVYFEEQHVRKLF